MKTKPSAVPQAKGALEANSERRRLERLAVLLKPWRRRFNICSGSNEGGGECPMPGAPCLTSPEPVSPVGPANRKIKPRPANVPSGSRRSSVAFTLLELLVVIGIIALLAAISMPVLRNFKPSYTASATRQLLDDLARARQLAISQRTTVYMVFVPTNFWGDQAFGKNWTPSDFAQATNLFDKQLTGYTFVSLRGLGDQPGRGTARHLSPWKALPEGTFIHPAKFGFTMGNPSFLTNPPVVMNIFTNGNPQPAYRIYGFNRSDVNLPFPFPSETTARYTLPLPYLRYLPYIAFDHMGRLVSGREEIIPLSQGSVNVARDKDRRPVMNQASFVEQPAGNTTNAFNLVCVDPTTGRARVERMEVR